MSREKIEKFIMRKTLTILMILCTISVLAQSRAESYFSLIRKAEKEIVNNDLDAALQYYEKAFDEFDTPFVRELLQATIVSSFMDDKEKFYELIPKCIERGVHKGEFMKLFGEKFEDDSIYNQVILDFDDYHQKYLNSIENEIYACFDSIDILDRIKTKQSVELDRIQDMKVRGLDEMTKLYVEGIKKYGWPTESKVGIGNLIVGEVLKSGKKDRLSQQDQDNIKSIIYDSIICNDTSDRYVIISGKSVYTTVLYQNTRKGNSFLWHLMAFEDSTLNNFIIDGSKNLKIHPLFVAQAVERSQKKENDCLLGMGSNYYMNELRYKRHKKYEIPNQVKKSINHNREKYFLPTIKEEEELLKALYYLNTGKHCKQLKKSTFKKNDFLFSIFTNTNVG